MACTSSTAPINISEKDYTDDCSLKCLFKYDYPKCPSSTIKNKGNYLEISYDKVKATYNNTEIIVDDIRIYAPSLHKFNGENSDAEMVISHMDMGVSLLVCIPIVLSSIVNDASTNLNYIISQAASKTSNIGEEAVISIKNFTLNSFIPKKAPLYSYNASLPYSPCNGSHDYVVFMPNKSPVFISPKTLGLFKKVILAHDSTIKPNKNYYYNSRGALFSQEDSDDIYIECHPTGADGNIIPVPSSGKPPKNKPVINFDNPNVIIGFAVVGGVLLILIMGYIIKFIRKRGRGTPASSAASSVASVASSTGGEVFDMTDLYARLAALRN